MHCDQKKCNNNAQIGTKQQMNSTAVMDTDKFYLRNHFR